MPHPPPTPSTARRRGVLLSSGWTPLEAAYDSLDAPSSAQTPRRLFLQRTPITAHDLLLAYCQVLLHHGGSGTVAAALAAGVPQVVVPLQFDQPFWAGRLEHLGLAAAPLDASWLAGSGDRGPVGRGEGGGGVEGGGEEDAGGREGGVGEAAAVIAGRLLQARGLDVVRRCADMAQKLQVRAWV